MSNLTNASARALLAMLLCVLPGMVAAQSPGDYYAYGRNSSFSYFPNGQLMSETLEPGHPNLCLRTTYEYDDWGNKSAATAANCEGAEGDAVFTSRRTTQTWFRASMPTFMVGPRELTLQKGQFPLDSVNAAAHASAQLFDPRFGLPIEVKDANDLKVAVIYDDLGRKIKEVKADGNGTVWRYCILASANLDTSTNSTGCGTLDYPPPDAIQYVQSYPINTTGTKSGPWSAVFVDRLGRTIREAREGFDGDEQTAGLKGAIILRDTVYNAAGAKVIETQPYWGATGTSTNSGSNSVGATKTILDVLGRPTAVYVADENATNQTTLIDFGSGPFGHGAYGQRKAAVTSMVYSGNRTVIFDDRNYSRTEEKNPLGEVFRITDFYGAQIVLQNDAFGNLRYTRDPLSNRNVVSYDFRGRKVALNDRDSGNTTYGYTAAGDLVRQQTPIQRAKQPATSTTYKYDGLGRKVEQTDDEYTSTWIYDQYAGGGACLKGLLCESQTTHGVRKRYWYDGFGRPTSERVDVSNGVSMAQSRTWSTTNGRLTSRTWPTGFRVKYEYTTLGYLNQVSLPVSATIKPLPSQAGGQPPDDVLWAANKVIWRAMRMNAWGRYEAFSNSDSADALALDTRLLYKSDTGLPYKRMAGINTGNGVLNQEYGWDALGRLTSRADMNGKTANGDDVTEAFQYDIIGRLTQYSVAGVDIPDQQRTVKLTYNALGMLLKRSDVGEYTYPSVVNGVDTIRPHALKSLRDLGGVDTDYFYDNNGNLISATGGKYRAVQYTSFNQPSGDLGLRGPSNSPKHTWQYDEAHARIKEVLSIASGTMAGTQTTWRWHPDNAGGLGFEHEINAPTAPSQANPATQQSRHYLSAAGQVVAVFVMDSVLPTLATGAKVPPTLAAVTLRKVEGWHVDHLGSLITTTDHASAVRARYSYDPFGQRRFTTGAADPGQTLEYDWSLATNAGTANGFTGHQHLDDVGVVHMNGRMYDARLGVFLQADPSIQDPFNLQSHNRYMYCLAGPLACTDPTGYNWISKTWRKIWRSQAFRSVAAVVIAYYLGPAATEAFAAAGWGSASAVAGGAVTGFATGAVASGTLEGGVQGAFSGAVFAGVGDYLNGTGAWTGGAGPGEWSVQGVALHGVAGCVTSVAGGGKCGPGALSAAFSQAAMPLKQGYDPVGGIVISAAIGGTASVLGGGKFENGATTAAYGYLFNECLHTRMCGSDSTSTVTARAGVAGGFLGNASAMSADGASLHFGFDISDGYGTISIDGGPSDSLCFSDSCRLIANFDTNRTIPVVWSEQLSPPAGMGMPDLARAVTSTMLQLSGTQTYSFPGSVLQGTFTSGYNSNSIFSSTLNATFGLRTPAYDFLSRIMRLGYQAPGYTQRMPMGSR